MPIPFTIRTKKFAKKADALAYFKEMLNRYRPGDRVSDTDTQDLSALLEHHTEFTEKTGAGIDHFRLCITDTARNLSKSLGSMGVRDDFSYKHCITPKRD
jgi:hypothetical protein